jgi:transposase
MRYARGGGLTPERQGFRERVRLEAAERFAAGHERVLIAKELRVRVRSVRRWRRAWSVGGEAALLSTGPVSVPVLGDELFAVLEVELGQGAVAHGRPDQAWTLARIAALIGRRFHKSHTPQGVAALLHRHGRSHQVPARRALERDDAATAAWVKEARPAAEERRRRPGPGSSSRTKPGPR